MEKNDTRIQRRFLQEPNLTYKEAFETAQTMEIAARDFQDITQQQHQQNVKPIAVHRLMDKTESHHHSCYHQMF